MYKPNQIYSVTLSKRAVLRDAREYLTGNGNKLSCLLYEMELDTLLNNWGSKNELEVFPLPAGYYTTSWGVANNYWRSL